MYTRLHPLLQKKYQQAVDDAQSQAKEYLWFLLVLENLIHSRWQGYSPEGTRWASSLSVLSRHHSINIINRMNTSHYPHDWVQMARVT